MQMTCLRGTMTNIILCDVTASVSELKNDPVASAGAGCGYSVAIIDSNRPVFYCVPAVLYEKCSIFWTKKTRRN